MNEEKFLVQEPENIEHEATIEEVELRIEQSSTMDYIDVSEPEEFTVEIEESVGWANGNGNITHASLPDKDAPNQHTIGAIEGLQDILNRLSAIKDTVYATKGGFAEFRPWLKQGYYDTEDLYQGTGGVGYFVSLVTAQDNLDGNNIYIDICKKINNDGTVDTNDVYGITVAHSGFCGYHGDTDNPNYAQVCLLGDVKVRVSAEEHQKINIGDYVVPNELGYASKAENGVGFKVVSKGQIETAGSSTTSWYYVEIALVPQNDNIARVVQKIEETKLNLDKITITLGDLSDELGKVQGTNIQLGQDFKGLQDLVTESTNKIDTQLPIMTQMLEDAKEVATKADAAIAKVQLEYAEAVSKAKDAQSAVEGALSDVAELQKHMRHLAAWTGDDGSSGVVGFLAQAEKDHTELSSLTSAFGDNGADLTAIIQKIDENGAAIQHLVSHIDKYTLGEHSPAFGLSAEETYILNPGHIYVPTKDHRDEYTYVETPVAFKRGKYYEWAISDTPDVYTWLERGDVSTATSVVEGVNDGDLWYCWQGVYNNQGDKLLYEPGTLYCWDNTKKIWVAVASINNNSTARVTGLIRQTADELRSVYTDLEGNVSDMQQTVNGISTRVSAVEGNITQIEQTAKDITMGVYDPAEGSTSLGLLLNGMQSMSNYGGRMRILHVLETPTITGNRYSQPPMWDGTKFVFAEGVITDDGIYYPYPDDVTKYCKIVSNGYEVYTIGNEATTLLRTDVDNNKAAIAELTQFKTDTSQTLTTLTQQSDANSAKIASVAAGEYVVCSDINLEPTEEELTPIPTTRYKNPPTWGGTGFEFKEEDKDNGGAYCMFEGDNLHYYKLLFNVENNIVGYEQYELASTGSASIMQTVTQQGSSIGMIVDNNGVKGGVLVEAINNQSTATINANRINIDGLVSFTNGKNLNDWATTVDASAIAKVEVQYALSDSATTAPEQESDKWSSATPTWTANQFIWQRTKVTYANGTSDTSAPTCIQGAKGQDGQNGKDGQDGTGVAIQGTAYIDGTVGDGSIGTSYNLYKDAELHTQITNAKSGDAYLVDGYLFVYSGVDDKFTCVGEIQGPPGNDGYTPQKGIDYFDGTNGTNGEDGTSIIWQGSFDKAPDNPQNGWAYYNTTAKASYVYQNGWYQMSVDGVGVNTTTVTYGTSSSASIKPTDWSTTMPTVAEGEYLWTQTVIDYTDESKPDTVTYTYAKQGKNGVDGAPGQAGTSVTIESILYQIGDSATQVPTGGNWKEEVVGVPQGKYLWSQTTFSDGNVVYGVSRQGQDGLEGSSIVWKGERSSQPENGEKNWVYKDKEDGIVYICTGNGLWEPMVLDGSDGVDGANGSDGLSVYITYHKSTTTPNKPTGNGIVDGWDTKATSEAIWMSQKVAADVNAGEWSAPIKIKGSDGKDGVDGASIKSMTIEYAKSTTPDVPRDDEEDTVWNSNIPTDLNEDEYLWTRTIIDYTDDRDDTVTYTYSKQGKSGTAGTSVTVKSIEYKEGASATTAPEGDWSDTVVAVAEGNYLWTKTTFSDGKVAYGVAKQGVSGSNGNSLQVKYINSTTTPTIQNNNVSGWSDTIPTVESGKRTYMTQKMSNETNWSIPVQISAEDGMTPTVTINAEGLWVINNEPTSIKARGEDGTTPVITVGDNGNWHVNGEDTGTKAQGEHGVDGNMIEYVYYRSENAQTTLDVPSYDATGELSSEWTVSPQGITETYKYEYMSLRTKMDGTWSEFSTPVIWSKWGEKGQDGDGVSYKYYLSNSEEAPTYNASDIKWTDEPTGVSEEKQYEYVVQIVTSTSDGTTTSNISNVALWAKWGATGANGDPGVGVSDIVNYYMASSRSSGVQAKQNGTGDYEDETWTQNIQTISADKPYLWNYEETSYTDGNTKSTAAVLIGKYSKDGTNGRGIQSIEEFYCISSSDTCNQPGDTILDNAQAYSSTATENQWYTTAPPTNLTHKYLWNCERITYTDGRSEIFAPAIIGTHGEKGADGKNGKGITAITDYYRCSTGTSQDTMVHAWSTEVPTLGATNKYLWSYEKIEYDNGDTTATQPKIIAIYTEDGKNGKGISAVNNYYLTSDMSTGITKETMKTYDWSSIPTSTTVDTPYLWNYEEIIYDRGDPTITEPCIIGVHGATGAQGADGRSITKVVPQYYLSTSSEEPENGKWREAEPEWAPDHYIWTRSEIHWDKADAQGKTVTYTDAVLASALNSANATANTALDGLGSIGDIATANQLILAALCCEENGQTVINGSQILTGSIGALQIAAQAITTKHLAADAIVVGADNVLLDASTIEWSGPKDEVEHYGSGLGVLYRISEQTPEQEQVAKAQMLSNSGATVEMTYTEDVEGKYYYLSNTESDSPRHIVLVQYADLGQIGRLVIPSKVGEKSVSIGDWAFASYGGVTEVVISEGVTIGAHAFQNCSNLASITIQTMEPIGAGAFNGCESLKIIYCYQNSTADEYFSEDEYTKVYLGAVSSEADFEYNVNDGGVSVTITKYGGTGGNIVIPSKIAGYKVTSIGDYAFEYCSSLISVVIPHSVMSIGKSAFADCSNMTSITVPDSVTNIGDGAFYNCSSLTSVTIPDSVTSIGYATFYACRNLDEVTIGNSVTSIGDYAFDSCTSLTSITIPANVTSLGQWAFHGCSNLTSVTIPNNTISISNNAFNNCNHLATVYCYQNSTVDDYFTDNSITKVYLSASDEETPIAKENLEYLDSENADSITITGYCGDERPTGVYIGLGAQDDWIEKIIFTTANLSNLLTTENAITVIDGGKIKTGSITAQQIATEALMSSKYGKPDGSEQSNNIYATNGTFFDLADGAIISKNFAINDDTAYFRGTVYATAGEIGGCQIVNGKLSISGSIVVGSDDVILSDTLEFKWENAGEGVELGSTGAIAYKVSDYVFTDPQNELVGATIIWSNGESYTLKEDDIMAFTYDWSNQEELVPTSYITNYKNPEGNILPQIIFAPETIEALGASLSKGVYFVSQDNINVSSLQLTGLSTSLSDLFTTGTTTIDGSKITTGSITADQIDADKLTVRAANIIGKLKAEQIETGVLTVGSDDIVVGYDYETLQWDGDTSTPYTFDGKTFYYVSDDSLENMSGWDIITQDGDSIDIAYSSGVTDTNGYCIIHSDSSQTYHICYVQHSFTGVPTGIYFTANISKIRNFAQGQVPVNLSSVFTENTTTIDGGKITTGTVTASKLQGQEINLLGFNKQIAASFTLTGASSFDGRKLDIQTGAISIEANAGDVFLRSRQAAYLQLTQDSTGWARFGAHVCPPMNNNANYNLGASSYKWNDIYAKNSAIQTSDRTQKKDIAYGLNNYDLFFDSLKPCNFRFIDGHERIHTGFISQDVEESLLNNGLTSMDFAGFIKSPRTNSEGENEYDYMLRYEEFIALNTWQIQKLKAKNNELEDRIRELEAKLAL